MDGEAPFPIYTAEDITEETLEGFPELRPLVRDWEEHRREPTPTEALLLNVIGRQAAAMYAQAQVVVQYAHTYGWLRHDVVA